VVSFTHRPLYPRGKSRRYPFDRELNGPQSWPERGGEEKNSLPQPDIESPVVLVTILTELSCLPVVRFFFLSSFLGSTAQLRPWPPPQNQVELLGGFSTIFFFTG
jgi:hypothetical protein